MARTRGVTFPAWRGSTFIPLIEVLVSLGPHALGRQWRFEHTEFGGGRSSEFLARADQSGVTVSSLELIGLVADGIQLIDGTVIGESRSAPLLVIRSVRGDEWEVEYPDEEALAMIRSYFDRVVDLPTD